MRIIQSVLLAIVYHRIFRIIQLDEISPELRSLSAITHNRFCSWLTCARFLLATRLSWHHALALRARIYFITDIYFNVRPGLWLDLAVENVSRTLYRSTLPLRNEVSRCQYKLFTHISPRHISESARVPLNLSPIKSYLRYIPFPHKHTRTRTWIMVCWID